MLRKKQLINLSYELKKKLEFAQSTILQLNNKISRLEEENMQLKLKNEAVFSNEDFAQQNGTLSEKAEQKPPTEEKALCELPNSRDIENHTANEINDTNIITSAEDIDFGASIIGKTVYEAAKACNVLTGKSAPDNAKELVNLILGRTEIAKAEIFRIVSSGMSLEHKKSDINEQYEQAVDYFKSVISQVN